MNTAHITGDTLTLEIDGQKYTEKIEVKEAKEIQPRNTSMRQSRVLETTVLASTGQKLRLEWEVTAMLDEAGQWKVTEANLYSWQGVSE